MGGRKDWFQETGYEYTPGTYTEEMPLSPPLVLLAQWSSVRCLLCSEHCAWNLVEKVEVEHREKEDRLE